MKTKLYDKQITTLYKKKSGIVPFVATLLNSRFLHIFTVAYLLFLAPVKGSNPAGKLPNPIKHLLF